MKRFLSPAASSFLLRWAARIVPPAERDDWEASHTGPLWEWTQQAAAQNVPDSQFALTEHLRRAWLAALRARFSPQFFGGPRFCLTLLLFLIAAVVLFSKGLPVLRALARPLPYHDPNRLVVLAQGPPIFGMRLGFLGREVDAFRQRGHSIESVAAYTWTNTVFASAGKHRTVIGAEVAPGFFDVLGVAPAIGGALQEVIGNEEDTTFLASNDFWRNQLAADPKAIGQRYEIGGHLFRLTGVLPKGFQFLSTPIAVWTIASPELPVPSRRWWRTSRGAIARLRPGVLPADAANDLLQALRQAGMGRRNFNLKATPIADLVYRPLWSYGTDFVLALMAVLLWAGFYAARDHRRGAVWPVVSRYWGFFVLKTALLLASLFVVTFEFAGVARLGVTGGVPLGQGPLGIWFFYSVLLLILLWAWRDQPKRCRVCLQRMYHPIRIGIPGHVLLETSGEEVMCPAGHGSVFTTVSVMGAELSDRWLGLS